MQSFLKLRIGLFLILFLIFGSVSAVCAGVSDSIQEEYIRDYEAKRMFLRIPIYEEEQYVFIQGQTFRVASGLGSPLHKVGDRLRIGQIRFGRDEIKFQLEAEPSGEEVNIIYRFDAPLLENFPNREVFDRALESSFTEGLKSSDIDNAKKTYLEREFDRTVQHMAGAASVSREFVLETVAPLIPDYRQTQVERDDLKGRVQDISTQLGQLRAEKEKVESELDGQKAELAGLQSTNTSLQKKLADSESQILQIDKELQAAEEKVRGFERQIADIQGSLNMEADANRDLARNNQELADSIRSLQEDLKTQKSEKERLAGEIEDNEKKIRTLNGTIRSLTSNKDSLGRQYVDLKDEKEKLDDFVLAVDALQARVVEEKTDNKNHYIKAEILLEDVRLGTLEWSIPSHLSHNSSGDIEAVFSAESIDYVKITPEVRQILKTFGEKLKIGTELDVLAATMQTSSDSETEVRDVGERENAAWNWRIVNTGTENVPFILSAYLINSHSKKISLFRTEYTVATANSIQMMRSYLQPIPLAAGVVLGFLLFGIVGIFRRPKARKSPPKPSPKAPAEPKPHVTEKKL